MNPSLTFTAETEGFSGYLYPAENSQGRCMLILAGDDGNDFLSQAFARWFQRHQNISALTIALRQDPTEDRGISLWNLNILKQATDWLHRHDYHKIGICGISMQAVIALSAAARIPDFSMTIAFSPCDYVPWGFRRDPSGKKEYPTGKSLLTFKGQPLPFQEAGMEAKEYWNLYETMSRKYHEPHAKAIFDRSEERHPLAPQTMIPAEQIRGTLILAGAEDDSMWNSTRYIHRLRKRLREKEFIFPVKYFTYAHGTHLLLPQRMLTDALPVFGGLVSLLYREGRRHPCKCRAARISLDRKLSSYLSSW